MTKSSDWCRFRIFRWPGLACMLLCGLLVPTNVVAQGYSPQEVISKMTVAPGFEVSLYASEPLVRQPVCIEFDDRGRLWVIQYLQYPNPAGLNRVKVDRYSRTAYDRVPEPPPHGPRGADRITILEDTDADGQVDASHDFVEGLNLTTGLAFGHGGVFVLNVPYLLFYPDRDRDDVPDSDPEVLLTGFGMEDAHSVANSLAFGPDGWLYGCQGSTVTANIRGIEFQQGVWRYHPETKAFELFCEGGGNSWGLDFDRRGELLYSTNYGGVVMLHAEQGGYYWKSFGKHGALHNPFAYGYFDHVPHANPQGGHVTAGGVIYQSLSFPASFRGAYIAADLLGHAVHWHTMAPRGSTFSSAHGGTLLQANDTWFAPCDVTIGPDGAVYVADWHDQRTGHPDPDANWDRSNGRVFRIQATKRQGPKPVVAPADLFTASSARLLELIASDDEWLARRARRRLAERRDPEALAELRRGALADLDEHATLAAVWTLAASGACDEPLLREILRSQFAAVRSWAVRLACDGKTLSPELADALDEMAETDQDVGVRSQLACSARRVSAAQAMPILHALLIRNLDGQDPYMPLLLWWAIEQHVADSLPEVMARFRGSTPWQEPLTREVIVERLARRLAAASDREHLDACAELLRDAPTPELRDRLLYAVEAGLRDQAVPFMGPSAGTLLVDQALVEADAEARAADRTPELPAALIRIAVECWRAHPDDVVLLRLADRVGEPDAYQHALGVALNPELPGELRAAMLGVLSDVANPACVEPLLGRLLEKPQPDALAILGVLSHFADPRIGATLVDLYASADDAFRSRARDVLLGRAESALLYLQALDRGDFDPKDVPLEQVRRIALHKSDELDGLVHKLWGNVQGGTREEKLAEVRRLNNDLRAAAGDRIVGRELFKKHCGTCHQLFGEGNRIGPDLTTANRQDRDYLLVSIVDPSVVVRREYLSFVVQTKDGQILTGLIVDQTPSSVTLLNAKNERVAIRREEIDELDESPLSLMPENAYKELSPQQLRDLFSYLQGEAPPRAASTNSPPRKDDP